MNLLLKKKTCYEIHDVLTHSLINIGFSNKITYLIFKQKTFIFPIVSRNIKTVNLKFKMSRFEIKKYNNFGKLTGFYWAIW